MPKIRKANPAQDPKYQNALKERDRAVETVKFALQRTGNIIRTWVEHFDRKFERQIDCRQFCSGLRALKFEGDPELLFLRIDIDRIDEVTFDQIDPDASRIWMGFRMWSVKSFRDEKHMISELSRDYGLVNREAFVSNLQRLGWNGHEAEIFVALNLEDKQELRSADLRFFTVDKRKYVKAQKGMQDALKFKVRVAKKRHLVSQARKNFKVFLKKKFGTLLRAWRTIDADDSMYMQKNELFRAVKDLCWQGDARLLWKGLDKDGSGVTSLQELDLKSAEQLAKFKQQVIEKFGDAQSFFRAIDVHRINKVRVDDFLERCQRLGFTRVDKRLFHGLDWEGRKFLMAKDLHFVDVWKCPQYLTCDPNPQAAKDFKKSLLEIYPTILKAWRHLLDRDGSNCVGWEEFEASAKRLSFTGDVPGAWRFFDQDISGSISLGELDAPSYAELSRFKVWADEEFGGVRAAFSVLDEDRSGDFNQREFIKMLRFYGFQGDCRALFLTLDCEGQGAVALNDVAFLDFWESEVHIEEPETPKASAKEHRKVSPRISPRLEELARSKTQRKKLPLLPVASNSTLASCSTTSFSKAYLLKSVYGRFSDSASPFASTEPGFNRRAWRKLRVRLTKEEILQAKIEDVKEKLYEASEAFDVFETLRKKTIALRHRTMELFNKESDEDLTSFMDVAEP